MSETTAIVPAGQMSIDEVMTVGKTMAQSGYFSDAKQAAQAVVKILAGREMGFGPFASMTGINIIKGKPAIGGNLMAAAVKNHPKYDYRVAKLEADVCEIVFYEGTTELGRSVFTKEDAAAAEVGKMVAPGASKNMMARFARNMLFNRAMSNGVRWYCPDVFLGAAVYTPEELGATVDVEGEIIDITPTTTAPEPFVFDPTYPDVDHWPELRQAAVVQLGYNHVTHVRNTLKQIFDGDAANLTMEAGWAALVEHQQAKEDDAEPLTFDQAVEDLYGDAENTVPAGAS